jgi:hypothetical protein
MAITQLLTIVGRNVKPTCVEKQQTGHTTSFMITLDLFATNVLSSFLNDGLEILHDTNVELLKANKDLDMRTFKEYRQKNISGPFKIRCI